MGGVRGASLTRRSCCIDLILIPRARHVHDAAEHAIRIDKLQRRHSRQGVLLQPSLQPAAFTSASAIASTIPPTTVSATAPVAIASAAASLVSFSHRLGGC